MNVIQGLQRLEEVDSNMIQGEAGSLLLVCERGGANGFRQEIHHQMQISFIPFASCFLKMVVKPNYALVIQTLHHLKLTIMVPSVKHNLLDGKRLAISAFLVGAPYDAKRTIANHFLNAESSATTLPHLYPVPCGFRHIGV
mmetsp:Transcript_14787/g.39503  ORF Transcript_14787/g.39503 Transcript_14787/m.39503 type:complete len:141 (+) Transcript_14787:456-878(+)